MTHVGKINIHAAWLGWEARVLREFMLPRHRMVLDAVMRPLSEIVRTSAIYLGIAVLVIITMVVTMPALRMQALHLHGALLMALSPETFVGPQPSIAFAPARPAVGVISLEPIPEDDLPPAPYPGLNPSMDKPFAGMGSAGKTPSDPGVGLRTGPSAQVLAGFGVSRAQLDALNSYISRKYLVASDATRRLVDLAYVVGHEMKMDPLLLLAIMAVESRYNPYAQSQSGAQGLMQVMTKVHRDKFAKFGKDENVALNPAANVRVGALILNDCIKRRGGVDAGLACYVGATGPDDGGYGEKVQSERRRLALAASIPFNRDDQASK